MTVVEIAALVVASLFFISGIAGSILPVLPGAPLIWLGMIIYGLMAGFENLPWWFFAGQGLLTLQVMVVEYLTGALGSRYFGGSKASVYGATIGLFAGSFFFPIGLFIAPFIGAFIAELIFARKAEQALKAGFGAFVGFWGALPLKLILQAVMIVWFFIAIF